MLYSIDNNHMLQGPGVIVALIQPEASTQPLITPRSIILHSQSGPRYTPWEALIAYMRRADIVGEAHFLVNMDGTIVQAMPLNRRADCNYKANPFAISFETQDNGYPSLAVTPWSPAQLATIIGVVAAIGVKYGIPFVSPETWQAPGVGFHSQYPEWSSYTGKTCPGAARIAQMDTVRAAAASLVLPPIPQTPLEEDMLVVVNMINDDVNPNRRWVWNGVGADLLLNEGEFIRLKTIFTFHPLWDELNEPFGLTKAEIVRYGGEV